MRRHADWFRQDYEHAEAVARFVAQAAQALHPLALILFGSLARGDYHRRSDADFCVVLAESGLSPRVAYSRVVACDPSGVVQPVVYSADQFRAMLRQANGLALEVMADGIFLVGDEAYRQEVEQLAADVARRLQIERTATGWRILRPDVEEEGALETTKVVR